MVAHAISSPLHTRSPYSPLCHIAGTLHIPEHSNVFLGPIVSLVSVPLPQNTPPYCSQCYSNIWIRKESFWFVCLFFFFPSNHCICVTRIIPYFIFFILFPQISLHLLFSLLSFFNFNKNLI